LLKTLKLYEHVLLTLL